MAKEGKLLAGELKLGRQFKYSNDDDNSGSIYAEHGAYHVKGFDNGKHFNESFDKFIAAKKFYLAKQKTTKMAHGGEIVKGFNPKDFSLEEIDAKLMSEDILLQWVRKGDSTYSADKRGFIWGGDKRDSKYWESVKDKRLTMSDYGQISMDKGSENIYATVIIYEKDGSDEPMELQIYSKDNHSGLKAFANSFIKKMAHGGSTNSKGRMVNLERGFTTLFPSGSYELIREIKGTSTIPEGQYEIKNSEGRPIILGKSRFTKSSENAIDYDAFDESWGKFKASTRKSFGSKYAKGGGISSELKNFDLSNLDSMEQMNYDHFSKSMSKEDSLQVIINSVEGDYTQLSDGLSELAEKQTPTSEWTEAMVKRDGYDEGGKIVYVGDMPLNIDGREELTQKEAEKLAKHWEGKGHNNVTIEYFEKGGSMASGGEINLPNGVFIDTRKTTQSKDEILEMYSNQGYTAIGGGSLLSDSFKKYNRDKDIYIIVGEIKHTSNNTMKGTIYMKKNEVAVQNFISKNTDAKVITKITNTDSGSTYADGGSMASGGEIKGLVIKNIENNKYVETESNGEVTYTDNVSDAAMFWQDGEDSEADAESTLALLNDVHSDGFVLVETDEIRDYAKGGGIQAKQASVKSGYFEGGLSFLNY